VNLRARCVNPKRCDQCTAAVWPAGGDSHGERGIEKLLFFQL
jgi:hypothetical protein